MRWARNVASSVLAAALCLALASDPAQQLVESDNFFIIRTPADLTSDKLAQLQARLFQAEQGDDNPSSSLVPVTVAFEPSTEPYDLGQLKLGYYTMLLGLGTSPDDVVLKVDLSVGDTINSVDNVFFKGLTNLRLSGDLQWLTSQMCPLRSLRIDGDIHLGSGVGGLLTDSTVMGQIMDGGQQEYLFRNVSAVGGLSGRSQGQMNFVFVDSHVTTGTSSDECAGATTCGNYFGAKQNPAPSFEIDSSTLPNPIQDKKAPLITAAGVFSRRVLHSKLVQVKSQSDLDSLIPAGGSVVVIHPGVYNVSTTLTLKGDGITVIGLGFPVLRSASGEPAIKITGSSCTLASLIVDAPLLSFDQDILIDVVGLNAEIYDVTARTMLNWYSPVQKVKTATMLHIGAPQTYAENFWLWRGDHWTGPDLGGTKSFGQSKWDPYNINPYGLHVSETATGVTCLGAFVEHQLWNPIVWSGDGGVIVMSQGECAYTNNGVTAPDVAGNANPLPDLTPGVYYSLGKGVQKHTYIGGGIYNIFGEQYTQVSFPAMEVLSSISEHIDVNRCMIAGWVDSKHFTSVLRYQGKDYGPSLMGSSVSFNLCDLSKLLGSGPTPAPPPPDCNGVKCVISGADYYGTIAGWPTGQQEQKYDPNMTPGQCCSICAQDAKCAYWKEGNGNCFYFENPSSVPRDLWRNFTGAPPSGMWNVGIRDDVCCKCSSSGGAGACGPTPPSSNPSFNELLLI